MISWNHGKHLVWDYTCHDTLAQSYLHLSSQAAGRVAEKADTDKSVKYQELAEEFIVMPVANETLGPWCPDSLKFVEEIGSRITANNGDKRATSHLFQSISKTVQRFNVVSIIGSFPNSKTLNELFYLN